MYTIQNMSRLQQQDPLVLDPVHLLSEQGRCHEVAQFLNTHHNWFLLLFPGLSRIWYRCRWVIMVVGFRLGLGGVSFWPGELPSRIVTTFRSSHLWSTDPYTGLLFQPSLFHGGRFQRGLPILSPGRRGSHHFVLWFPRKSRFGRFWEESLVPIEIPRPDPTIIRIRFLLFSMFHFALKGHLSRALGMGIALWDRVRFTHHIVIELVGGGFCILSWPKLGVIFLFWENWL